MQALFDHLKEVEAEEKRKGRRYASPPQRLEFRVTAEHLEFVIDRAKKAERYPEIVALLKRLNIGLKTCDAAKDSAKGDFGVTLQAEIAHTLIQDWAIAAIRFVLNEETDLQFETSPIAEEVHQILTAWLPDFVMLNFAFELSKDMQIAAKPIVGVDNRQKVAYLPKSCSPLYHPPASTIDKKWRISPARILK